MATPCVTVVEVGTLPRLSPVAASKNWTAPEDLSEAASTRPSGDTSRLYGPGPVGKRAATAQRSRSIARISFERLHATQTRRPSGDGSAHVGEQVGAAAWCS